jgi:hypothetical protein
VALSSTERARSTRERHKRGACIVPVEIYRDELYALARLGLLPYASLNDRGAIGASVRSALAAWLARAEGEWVTRAHGRL